MASFLKGCVKDLPLDDVAAKVLQAGHHKTLDEAKGFIKGVLGGDVQSVTPQQLQQVMTALKETFSGK